MRSLPSRHRARRRRRRIADICSSGSTTRRSSRSTRTDSRDLALTREDAGLAPVSGGDRRPRHLLRPAVRAQPRDARRARSDRHARRRASIPPTLRRDRALHEAVLDQQRARTTTSPRASSCSRARPRRSRAAAHAAARDGAAFPLRGRRDARRPAARGSRRCSSTPASIRPSPTRRRGLARTSSKASANNLYAGVTMARSRRIRGAASAELASGEARAADWSKRSIASAAGTARQIARDRPRISQAAHALCDRADGRGARAR